MLYWLTVNRLQMLVVPVIGGVSAEAPFFRDKAKGGPRSEAVVLLLLGPLR